MTGHYNAILIAAIFLVGLVGFATDRIRHDLVALAMLGTSLVLGLVPVKQAFTGFADPVVITVAAVMVISAAISRSGMLARALRPFRRWMRAETGIAIVFALLCGVASAFMNNVGALALLLPAALATCRSAKVSPSRILMPMAFASLLGGLVTLIGTPPNVILAELRTNYGGAPFAMFDFARVGLPLAAAGLLLTIFMVRFLPKRASSEGEPLKFRIADYLFELRVPKRGPSRPLTVEQLSAVGGNDDRLAVHAIDRGGVLVTAPRLSRALLAGDIVQVEGRAPIVELALERYGLELASDVEDDLLEGSFIECVVTDKSHLIQHENASQALAGHGASLVAVSRKGKNIAEGLASLRLQGGDVLLLQVAADRSTEVTDTFHLLPLAERALNLRATAADWLPLGALLVAILTASAGLTSLSVALLLGVTALGLTGRLKGHVYQDIDWPIILLLAALIPVAEAFSKSGAGESVASLISSVGQGRPEWVLIAMALGLTMAVTPFLNNAAAVLIMGPIAASAGVATGVPVDAMLMAVAIGASCDFLTPIGHQSNTLVWGPGGYRFSDYARVGTPLTALVLVFGTFLITHFWG
ncbi:MULTISPECIES: SLC13 family permease [unclassified Novosphingobium]|uniref:SLC13 family permease n=1 Tax=unclassified Novosphingobium TaxID=2644732 RepID=UPI0025D1BB54|nr:MULTISPECIES: SLC13 family permease [unclassified Novosphingobium]HQV02555.1 SLC13 family permease [Novosphingobium sp.]